MASLEKEYTKRFNQKAEASGFDVNNLTHKQKENIHQQLSQNEFNQKFTGQRQVNEEYLKQTVEGSGIEGNRTKVGEDVRMEAEQAYRERATALSGRLGSSQVNPKLSPAEMNTQIQNLDEVKFSSESTGAYHAYKHYDELPPSHRTGGSEIDNYLKSVSTTIKNSSGQPDYSFDQAGNRIFTFRASYTEVAQTFKLQAIVKVTPSGKVILLTYFKDNK